MARPKLSSEKLRDKPLRIRLSPSERTAIDQAAAARGFPSATWARELLLKAARRKSR